MLKDEGEQVLGQFFSKVSIPEYRYEICSKMYDFYMHFSEPRQALAALSRAIVEDAARAEAYYKLGRHLSDKADQPTEAIPLLTVASMIRLPSYGTPEAEAYGSGPWEALARAHFRLENIDAARRMAAEALKRKPPDARWLTDLAAWDEAAPRVRSPARRNGRNGPKATSARACRAGRSFASSKKTDSAQRATVEAVRAFDRKPRAAETRS